MLCKVGRLLNFGQQTFDGKAVRVKTPRRWDRGCPLKKRNHPNGFKSSNVTPFRKEPSGLVFRKRLTVFQQKMASAFVRELSAAAHGMTCLFIAKFDSGGRFASIAQTGVAGLKSTFAQLAR